MAQAGSKKVLGARKQYLKKNIHVSQRWPPIIQHDLAYI